MKIFGALFLVYFTVSAEAKVKPTCGLNWVQFGEDKCFKFYASNSENWYDARLRCIMDGGNLATIENRKESAFLIKEAKLVLGRKSLQDINWWIGLQDYVEEGNFTWAESGVPPSSSIKQLWSEGEPDNGGAFYSNEEDCVALYTTVYDDEYLAEYNGKFSDLNCEQRGRDIGFICEKYLLEETGIFTGDMFLELDIDPDSSLDDVGGLIQDEINKQRNNRNYWTNGVVPIRLDRRFPQGQRFRIQTALRILEKEFCGLTFPPYNGTQENYILVAATPAPTKCASTAIGMKGGKQKILLGRECFTNVGVVIHELLHSLGIPHEHQRPDRDNFIEIERKNIIPLASSQFDKLADEAVWSGVDYDTNSIMHYADDAFSIRPRSLKTIRLKDKSRQTVMGQRRKMSESDIKKVNNIYPCGGADSCPACTCAKPEACPNSKIRRQPCQTQTMRSTFTSRLTLHDTVHVTLPPSNITKPVITTTVFNTIPEFITRKLTETKTPITVTKTTRITKTLKLTTTATSTYTAISFLKPKAITRTRTAVLREIVSETHIKTTTITNRANIVSTKYVNRNLGRQTVTKTVTVPSTDTSASVCEQCISKYVKENRPGTRVRQPSRSSFVQPIQQLSGQIVPVPFPGQGQAGNFPVVGNANRRQGSTGFGGFRGGLNIG